MQNILANIPIWVPFLFVLLLIVGLRSTKDRRAPTWLVLALPLLGGLTLMNLILLDPTPVWWGLAVMAYALAARWGANKQGMWLERKTGSHVFLKGEWITLTAMMILFCAGFTRGFLTDVSPASLSSPLFLSIYITVISAASGHFLGRAYTTARTPVSASSMQA